MYRNWVYYILSFFLISTLYSCQNNNLKPQVVDGAIALSSWDFSNNGITDLNGNWNFYWNQRLKSTNDLTTSTPPINSQLPGYWTEGSGDSMKRKAFGLGTYHLKLTLPDSTNNYFIKLNAVNNAYELWGNGQLLTKVGIVGTSEEKTSPDFQTKLVKLPKSRSIDFFLIVANWKHRRGGGVYRNILIGTENQIRTLWKNNYTLELSLFLFIITISLYSLTLYFFNKDQKGYLYVAAFAILGALRNICIDEIVIKELIPNLPFFVNQQLRYIGFFMSLGFLFLYISEIFKEFAHKYLKTGFYFAVLFSIATIILPFQWASYISPIYQIIVIPYCISCFYTGFKALPKFKTIASLVIIGGIIGFATMVHGILIANTIVHNAYTHQFGYTLFVLMQALILVVVHMQIHAKAKHLAQELTILNKSLEQKVVDRTLEIREKQEKLHVQSERLKTAYEQLQELDKSKSRFFANISHELRTPLTIILEGLKQLKKKFPNLNNQQDLEATERNSKHLHQLINQLLDINKLESGKLKLQVQEVEIIKLLKGLMLSYESFAEQKNIQLSFEANHKAFHNYIDASAIEKVVNNLLANAIKFTSFGGQISIQVEVNDDSTTICVKDTGIGIPQDKLPHIFNRFFQVETELQKVYEGTGIGLSLVKELISLHRGTITVQSQEGIGSIFTVNVPSSKSAYNPEELVSKVEMVPVISPKDPVALTNATIENSLQEAALNKENPLVLIVEDHPDLQELIKANLADQYQIIQAYNGEEGIEMALEHIPDLIISDVMMPKKNGFDLCKQLKTDKRSSHIPIVMLTARIELADKLHGLENGADDYLAKPFEAEELKIRVRNLIQIRRKLREQFAQKTEFVIYNPKEVKKSKVDNQFMDQLLVILEENYINEYFAVDDLAEAISLSRRQLNRKLKAMIDSSASKVIQNYRLQKSIELLHDSTLKKSDIAFMVGFGSVTYFNKCFKDKFGKTPNEYQAEL